MERGGGCLHDEQSVDPDQQRLCQTDEDRQMNYVRTSKRRCACAGLNRWRRCARWASSPTSRREAGGAVGSAKRIDLSASRASAGQAEDFAALEAYKRSSWGGWHPAISQACGISLRRTQDKHPHHDV
ncbi:MAG: hypothetical protein U0V48_15690 [Anaerolineales bacterium]